jgi:hypothetical protein
MLQEVIVGSFGVFGSPFRVSLILPFFIISDAGRIRSEFQAFISFNIKTK